MAYPSPDFGLRFLGVGFFRYVGSFTLAFSTISDKTSVASYLRTPLSARSKCGQRPAADPLHKAPTKKTKLLLQTSFLMTLGRFHSRTLWLHSTGIILRDKPANERPTWLGYLHGVNMHVVFDVATQSYILDSCLWLVASQPYQLNSTSKVLVNLFTLQVKPTNRTCTP